MADEVQGLQRRGAETETEGEARSNATLYYYGCRLDTRREELMFAQLSDAEYAEFSLDASWVTFASER